MTNRWNLKNKKALITGGTKGIGEAIAKEFIDLGAEVLVVSRNNEDFEKLKSLFNNPDKLCYYAADVSKLSDIEKLADFVNTKWGKLDILINNVGTNIRKKSIEYSYEEFDKIIHTNLRSAFELSKSLYPLLKK